MIAKLRSRGPNRTARGRPTAARACAPARARPPRTMTQWWTVPTFAGLPTLPAALYARAMPRAITAGSSRTSLLAQREPYGEVCGRREGADDELRRARRRIEGRHAGERLAVVGAVHARAARGCQGDVEDIVIGIGRQRSARHRAARR